MMQFFAKGETKVRPGVYGRYEDATPAEETDLVKVCACMIKSNWGPLNTIIEITPTSDLDLLFGKSGTISVIKEILSGKCQIIKAIRLGETGTKGAVTITNTEDVDVLKLEMKYPGTRQFAITIRESVTDPTKKELILLEGSTQLNKIIFNAGGDEVTTLYDFMSEVGSPWYTITKISDSAGGTLPNLSQKEITVGTDPSITTQDYSEALTLLESDIWDVLCLDTNDTAIHTLVSSYIDRIFYNGAMVMAVLGEPNTVAFSSRCTHAANYNSHNIVYVGASAIYDGVLLDGYMAAARVAGMMCGYDSSQSLTHKTITGATDMGEKITNEQYIEATKSGMLLFSKNRQGVIRIENAINTLVNPVETPEGTEDEGWKKIKRVLIRHELMNRIDMALDEKTSNDNAEILMDDDGIAEIKAAIFGVIDEMQNERKLYQSSPTVEVDTSIMHPDSSGFIIAVDDIDSMEKVYLTYRYRYQKVEEEV